MTQSRCDRCSATGPAHDFISAGSNGTWRVLCSRCFNSEMARFADVHNFQHPSFTPLHLRDADGNDHKFHFRSLLLGDQLSLEAFELAGHDEFAGYRFQVLGEAGSEPFALLGRLIRKMKRAVVTKHLRTDSGSLQVAETTLRGRIEGNGNENGNRPCVVIDGRRVEWNDFGAMLLAFEGWQFRLEMFDPSDEA
ncbi:hypothetical protein AWB68_08586 [Caballeronia choica]|uniref:Uncharacterized protein n=2 Tax=Caballeronia choica TaxID=326476 RepID=A0A158L3K9_9BURK|nr:hypothetical protein AWB68_08586 [Caballeronia choica]